MSENFQCSKKYKKVLKNLQFILKLPKKYLKLTQTTKN